MFKSITLISTKSNSYHSEACLILGLWKECLGQREQKPRVRGKSKQTLLLLLSAFLCFLEERETCYYIAPSYVFIPLSRSYQVLLFRDCSGILLSTVNSIGLNWTHFTLSSWLLEFYQSEQMKGGGFYRIVRIPSHLGPEWYGIWHHSCQPWHGYMDLDTWAGPMNRRGCLWLELKRALPWLLSFCPPNVGLFYPPQ